MFKLLRYGALALAMFSAQSGLQAQKKVMSPFRRGKIFD